MLSTFLGKQTHRKVCNWNIRHRITTLIISITLFGNFYHMIDLSIKTQVFHTENKIDKQRRNTNIINKIPNSSANVILLMIY